MTSLDPHPTPTNHPIEHIQIPMDTFVSICFMQRKGKIIFISRLYNKSILIQGKWRIRKDRKREKEGDDNKRDVSAVFLLCYGRFLTSPLASSSSRI